MYIALSNSFIYVAMWLSKTSESSYIDFINSFKDLNSISNTVYIPNSFNYITRGQSKTSEKPCIDFIHCLKLFE